MWIITCAQSFALPFRTELLEGFVTEILPVFVSEDAALEALFTCEERKLVKKGEFTVRKVDGMMVNKFYERSLDAQDNEGQVPPSTPSGSLDAD